MNKEVNKIEHYVNANIDLHGVTALSFETWANGIGLNSNSAMQEVIAAGMIALGIYPFPVRNVKEEGIVIRNRRAKITVGH